MAEQQQASTELAEEAAKAAAQDITSRDDFSRDDFSPGDLVQVQLKIVEGQRQRLQMFEGVCIARKGRGVGASFTLRKISHGEGVERVFALHSPLIDSLRCVRRGRVRRAKLYYLRALRGKAARIAEKRR